LTDDANLRFVPTDKEDGLIGYYELVAPPVHLHAVIRDLKDPHEDE